MNGCLEFEKQPDLPWMAVQAVRRQPSQSRITAIMAAFYPQEVSSFSLEDLKEDISLVFYCEASKHAISPKPCLISVEVMASEPFSD